MILWLLACQGTVESTAKPTAPVAGFVDSTKTTQSGKYVVTLSTSPNPPGIGDLFEMQARVTTTDGEPVEKAIVLLDGRMPQHNHGMETQPRPDLGVCPKPADGETVEPKDCVHEDGAFSSAGFKFHMRGEWTVTVDVDGPIGRDTTSLVYTL